MTDTPITETEEPKYQPDDDQLSIQLAEEWSDKVRFFHGRWHVCKDGVWSYRQEQEINLAVRKFLRKFRSVGIRVTRQRVKSLAAMAEDDCFIPDREINAMHPEQRQYICLKNGLYNIETGELEPHKPELMFVDQLPITYEPGADCPMFRKFLRSSLVDDNGQTDEHMIQLVLEAIGYTMTARTDLKASFWLVGEKDSGKSTLVAILRGLMGDLHTTIDLNQMGANRFMLSQIAGKRAVTFTESSASQMLPDALYKAVVGGTDEIFADVKNREAISFVPEAKLWWAMNAAPRVNDRSGATFSRLHLILFNRTIPQSERITGLAEKCLAEASGIFDWVTYYLTRLRRAGAFIVPEQSQRWKEHYELENDTERSFVTEICQSAPNQRVQAQQLYDTYRNWCRQNGFSPKNANQAARDWKRLGLERTSINGKRYYTNITLAEF